MKQSKSGNKHLLWFLLLVPLAGVPLLQAEISLNDLPLAAKVKVDFRKDIYPLLKAHCFKCHQGSDASAGFRLDLRDEILGKTNGKAVVQIGNSGSSKLIHLVAESTPGKIMPKKGTRLTAEQIGLLRAWIDQGLAWDEKLLPGKEEIAHWSFQPITKPKLPKVKNAGWVINPIDAFIAAKQESRGLKPAPSASQSVLIRRLYLDLLGLPPSPKEIDTFINERSPDSYEKLVDKLLKSPHYGERWGRHWLDVARWSESEGYESNHLRPFAWRYRDYVVKSFNEDRPFDQFILQQLAGDEMVPYSDENLIATGFLAAARLSSNEEDKWRQRNDIMVDIVNATSSAFLGLTMNCAQCHNHKFDPITARDYYRFQGFFLKGQPANLALKDSKLWADYLAKKPPEYDAVYQLKSVMFEAARKRKLEAAKKKLSQKHIAALKIPADKRTEEEEKLVREADLDFAFTPNGIESAIQGEDRKLYEELKKKLSQMEKNLPEKPQTFGFYSPITSPTKIDVLPMKGFYPLPYEPGELALAQPYLLVGGDVHNRSFKLDVGWPEVFGETPPDKVAKQPRLALAKWLGSAKNPLTARVFVNRLWQYHFGRGIVATPADFGKKGAPPTHPELLDWLASEFIEKGWSTKHIHKLIVTSQTYRQSSKQNAENVEIDPDNDLLWHWKPRRLEAEVIRDNMLAVSGELNRAVGGPSVPDDSNSLRRTIYLLQKRDVPTRIAKLFDGPGAALESCSVRNVSTVPLQGLYLLNNEFCEKRSQALAKIVMTRAGTNQQKQIEEVFQITLGRLPDMNARKLALKFFTSYPNTSEQGNSPPQALVHFCQALMNVNEFVYLQ